MKVEGLSASEVGIHRATAKGNVLHLKKLEDLSGNYGAGDIGATAGGGPGATIMQNQTAW